MKDSFDEGQAVVLNVNKGRHWVLMTGYNETAFMVNDAGFNREYYLVNEVIGSGRYVKPAKCN